MLSSITPLGQRGRGQSWGRTVFAFWVGAVMTGAGVFGALGIVGEAVGATDLPVAVLVILLSAAAALDLLGVTPFGPMRQVDEAWLGRYRDWVVGIGFGAQLGAGVVTIVRTWSTWAVLLGALIVGSPASLGLGIAFGLGRSVLLLTAGRVHSSDSLSRTIRRFVSSERWAVVTLTAAYVAVIGVGVFIGA